MLRNMLVGTVQKAFSRSAFGVKMALKMREQCNSVVGLRCQSGIDPVRNGEAWLADRIAPQATVVIDVGANVGEWSLMFAARMAAPGRFLLFEPNPKTAASLRKVSWPASASDVTVLEKAAADVPGNAEFFAETMFGETSSLIQGHSNRQARTVTVSVTTLDDEMATLGMGHVDMLKIDAEGYDMRVLAGARRLLETQTVGAVQFEYNAPWTEAGSTLAFAFRFLQEKGYRVFLLKAAGLYRFDARRFGEYGRYSNFVALRPDVADRVLQDHTLQDCL